MQEVLAPKSLASQSRSNRASTYTSNNSSDFCGVVVATAMNQLVLARSLGQATYRPWELRRHASTIAARHASHFAAAWDTNTCAYSTRKIPKVAQRDASHVYCALCGDQKTQASAKNAPQTGLMALKSLSYVDHSEGSEGVGQVVIG